MRVLASATVLASLALLVGAASAPARVSDDDVRAAALHNVDANLGDAIKLEQNAVYLVDHGNEAGARSEIKNSESLLNKALPAADALTTPAELRQFAPPDTSWDRVGENTRSAITWDKRALEQSGGALATYVGIALKKKEAVYSLVHAEIKHPMCSELINLQGPITVNGVPQGSSQLSVDVACSRPVTKVIVALPGVTVMKMIPDGQVIDAILSAADVMQLKMNAGRSGGVTVETAKPVTGTQKIETEIIPIAGDSHPPEVITRVP
jgi:hypothetical protein